MAEKSEVNYELMEKIIKQFRSEADELNRVKSQTSNKVQGLHGTDWIGRGSEQFFSEMEGTVLPAMERLVNALHAAAGAADNIVKIYRNAEDEGQGVFKSLGE